MKTITKKIISSCLLLLFPSAVQLVSAQIDEPLFEDDFSSYAVGANTNTLVGTNGKWIKASSAGAANFLITADPPGSPDSPRRLLWSNTGNGNPSSLPRITSKTNFGLGDGLRIAFTLNTTFTGTGQYTRVGLVIPKVDSDTSFDKELYLDIRATGFSIGGDSSNWGEDGRPDFTQGQTYDFAWEFIRVDDEVRMSLYLDGTAVLRNELFANEGFSFEDDDLYKLYLGFRNQNGAIDSYIGDVSVTAIPEPGHVAVVAGVLGVALLWMRRNGRR